MIIDLLLIIVLSLGFCARMINLFEVTTDPFILSMLGLGSLLALIEMFLLRRYINSYFRKGWLHINTLIYLFASIPLLLLILAPIQKLSHYLVFILVFPVILILYHFITKLFNQF